MATIDVRKSHGIGKEKARGAAEQIAEKLKTKLDVKYRWDGDVLRFDRSGASGAIHVGETEVRVEVELGMLLRPMKGKVEEKVQQYLKDYLV